MYQQCEIVQDLLPLYVDEACSASSAAMIREHLENCAACKALYEKLCSDSAEEILKVEMAEVVAKHEKQIKRIRSLEIIRSVVITSIVAILVVFLLVWRIWPHASSSIIPVEKDAITSFGSGVIIQRLENGQTITESYTLCQPEMSSKEPGEILEILATSSYQQDFRNLLPWEADSVGGDKNYDGRMVMLSFSMGNQVDDLVSIQFLSSTIIAVSVEGENGFRVYHPTNPQTFDDLVEYIQVYGTTK